MRPLVLAVPLVLLASAPASAQPAGPKNGIKITWLGHAAFEIVSPGGTNLLIDPFLKDDPATPADRKDLSKYKPAAILVSHAHPDHAADAVAIAKSSGAKVISTFEWVSALPIPDGQKQGGNVGGTFTVGDVTVSLVPAMHSSEPGRPLGFVLKFSDGRTLYHTGDTWIFGDMALIQEIHKPTIILMNSGGGPFTQAPAQAALALKKYFKPKVIIPMHFGTFPGLASEADVIKAYGKDKRFTLMKPGESRTF